MNVLLKALGAKIVSKPKTKKMKMANHVCRGNRAANLNGNYSIMIDNSIYVNHADEKSWHGAFLSLY